MPVASASCNGDAAGRGDDPDASPRTTSRPGRAAPTCRQPRRPMLRFGGTCVNKLCKRRRGYYKTRRHLSSRARRVRRPRRGGYTYAISFRLEAEPPAVTPVHPSSSRAPQERGRASTCTMHGHRSSSSSHQGRAFALHSRAGPPMDAIALAFLPFQDSRGIISPFPNLTARLQPLRAGLLVFGGGGHSPVAARPVP
jgi:hypothetical protein